jgi:hypothetical protein
VNATAAVHFVSDQWRKDSSSCLGLRFKVYNILLKSKPDSLKKTTLFGALGKPNRISRFYSGVTKKSYVEYIYYTYKDECPKIGVEGRAIGFVFDEDEIELIEIVQHEFCG